MLDNLSQSSLIQSPHMRLPNHFWHSNPLDIDMQLRVVFLTRRIISAGRIIRRYPSNVGVQELVFTKGASLRGVVDSEGRIVGEKFGFDFFQGSLFLLFVFGIVLVSLSPSA